MLFLSIFLYVSLSTHGKLLNDGDTGYHIRAGEWILENFSIPRLDIFSFHSPPLPWTAHEWLSEVIMAQVHQVSGLTGIVIFFTLLLALTFYLLFRMIRQAKGNILVAVFVVLLATTASQIHWLARPHVFSLLLFVVWYWILEDFRHGIRNRLYLLPPMMLLWVNLHGGYLAGFMLMGIYLLGEIPGYFSKENESHAAARQRIKSLIITIAICIPVSCINPYGFHILLFPFNLVSNKFIMDNVSEFLSPNFHKLSPFKYLILFLITVLAISRERLRITETLLLLVFLNMSLYSARYIPLFAIIVAPLLVKYASQSLDVTKGRLVTLFKEKADNLASIDASSGGILWPVAAFVAVTWLTAAGYVHYDFDSKTKPVAAVKFLKKTNLPGNMFNNDEFGDYLIYSAWPLYKVFFDGRSDMYGTDRLKEYIQIINFKDGWEKTLEKYRVNWIFFDTNSRLTRFLKERKDWSLIYEDKVASIFIRNIEANRRILDKYEQKNKETAPLPE